MSIAGSLFVGLFSRQSRALYNFFEEISTLSVPKRCGLRFTLVGALIPSGSVGIFDSNSFEESHETE